jgi:hypothetical protein
MIALCLHHHQVTEGGAYTNDDLRRLKQYPYLSASLVRGQFEWRRKQLILLAGSNWFFSPPYVLRINNHVIVGLSDSEGFTGIDLDVRDTNGQPVFSMSSNDWLIDVLPDDIECSPLGNSLMVRCSSKQIRLDLKFHSMTEDKLDRFLHQKSVKEMKMLAKWRAARPDDLLPHRLDFDLDAYAREHAAHFKQQIAEWPAAIVTLSADILWPASLKLRTNQMTLPGGNVLTGNTFVGRGIDISGESIGIGAT